MKTFTRIVLIVVLLCHFTGLQAFAQAPQAFQYQAVVRDTDGSPLTETTVSIKLSLIPGSEDAVAEYSETHTKTTNKIGLITLEVGKGETITGIFESIDWGSTPMFLKVELDPDGGNAFTDMGTSQLL